jgi:hypothetical protein
MIGSGFNGRDLQTIFTADGQSEQIDTTSSNPFTSLSGLETDGFGNLVIDITSASHDVRTVSAWTLEAVAVPEPSSTALLGLGGLGGLCSDPAPQEISELTKQFHTPRLLAWRRGVFL